LSEIFLILRRNERDIVKNVSWSSCKVPVILVRFPRNFIFLEGFSKSAQIQNLMKIRPVGTHLFHAERRTDRHDEANSRFSQFCERALIFSFYSIMTTWHLHCQNKFGKIVGETVSVCYENHLKHVNVVKGPNVELLPLCVAQHAATTELWRVQPVPGNYRNICLYFRSYCLAIYFSFFRVS
jgi:hypothetical protein